MKFTRKLIPALAMLVVSATMMSTASFAWFSMNRTVTATGMQATAVAPVNLQISEVDEDAKYANAISYTLNATKAKLIPASSINGTKFYAVDETKNPVINNGLGGDVLDTSTVEFKEVATPIADNTDGYYVDFKFHLRLTSAVGEDTKIKLSSLTFDETTSTELVSAARVALLDSEGRLVKIYSAVNDKAKAIETLDTAVGSENTIKTLTETEAIAATDSSNTVFVTIPATKTKTFVTLRLWIEGQDADCTNANAAAQFGINVEFSVVS